MAIKKSDSTKTFLKKSAVKASASKKVARKPLAFKPSTKVQAIRDMAKALGRHARPMYIVADLRDKGIKVTPSQVSRVLRPIRRGYAEWRAKRAENVNVVSVKSVPEIGPMLECFVTEFQPKTAKCYYNAYVCAMVLLGDVRASSKGTSIARLPTPGIVWAMSIST